MQGTQAFQADAKSEIDLESFVAEDHTLRKVDRVLDLAFVRKLTAPCYSQLGAPSIDPEVFFRMLLVAYHYGITSDRRLCEEVRYNLAYRWFCRLSLEDRVPDHASLTRSRLMRAIAHASPTNRRKPKIGRKNASKKSTFSTRPTVFRDVRGVIS